LEKKKKSEKDESKKSFRDSDRITPELVDSNVVLLKKSDNKKNGKKEKKSSSKAKKEKKAEEEEEELEFFEAVELNESRVNIADFKVTSKYQLEIQAQKRANPINLTFEDLSYHVKVGKPLRKKTDKKILNGITGCVKSGEMLAILGSSGAGKSSLLNVLSGRYNEGTVTGKICVNGQEVTADQLQRLSAYVMQEDLMFPHLTVKETVSFSALLRIPNKTWKEKLTKVDYLLEELGLKHAANTIIGDPEKKGISGGERKRTNIANEIITDPSLIFLDEPTSGMDSFTALNIMETLVVLQKSGRTIVCTIHQPRSNIFSLFDTIMVLGLGGNICYLGPAKECVNYFSKLNFICPKLTNPADFLLDITSIDGRDEKSLQQTTENLNLIIESYQKSKMAKNTSKQLHILKDEFKTQVDYPKGFASNYFVQLYVLAQRGFKNFFRDRVVHVIRIVQTIIFFWSFIRIYLL